MELKKFAEERLKGFNPMTGGIDSLKPLKSQYDIFEAISDNRNVQIVHSRQVGVSTALALYAAYFLEGHTEHTKMWVRAESMATGDDFLKLVDRISNRSNLAGDLSISESNGRYRTGEKGKLQIVTGERHDVLRGMVNGILIVMNPVYSSSIEKSLLELNELKSYGLNLKIIIEGSIPDSMDFDAKVVKIHWSDNELWSLERYNAVLPYLANTDELDNLDLTYTVKKNKSLEKILQVRIKSETYDKLALLAADSDVSISEFVRKIISDSIND